jgi:hypothetical protein
MGGKSSPFATTARAIALRVWRAARWAVAPPTLELTPALTRALTRVLTPALTPALPSALALGLALGLTLGLTLGLALPDKAWAGEELFTVANFPLEARADNAVAAKERALAEGQQAAFHTLLKRLAAVTAYPRLKGLRDIRAGDLIEGVSVRSERNSSTEYIATLDFAFQSKAVRDLLRREGVPFTDEPAPALTVVPAFRAGTEARGEARWTDAWKSLDLAHALTPVRLETLKQGVGADSVNALAAGNGGALRALVASYGSELVVLALAEADAAGRRLTVTLAGRDAVGAFTLRRIYHIDPADPGYARDLAAVVSLGVLEGRWKAIKIGGSGGGGGGDMRIAVEFRGMGEWQDISRRLAQTPGIEELEVAGLSARGARVTLRFADGPERLAEALAGQGLSLRNGDGGWRLSLP